MHVCTITQAGILRGFLTTLTMEHKPMRISWHLGLGRELGLVLWALSFFEAAYGAFATIWPLWIEHLGASISTVGFVLGAAGVVRPFVLLTGSWLSDHVDVRKMLLVSRSILVAGVVFAAFAQTWEVLFITVAAMAFGELVFPILHGHIPVHAGDNPGRAFSLTCTIGPSVALIFTPFLTGAVIAVFGMQGGLLLSAAFSTAGLLCIMGMDFSQDAVFAAADTRASYADVVRHTDTRHIVIFHAVTIFALGLGSSLLPNFLHDHRGLSPQAIMVLSAGAAVGTALFGFASLRLAGVRQTPFRAAAISAFCAAMGLLIFATIDSLPAMAFASVLRGGLFATWTFLLTAVGQYAPARLQNRVFAVVEVMGGGAISFAPVVAGLLFGIHAALPLVLAAGLGSVMAGLIVVRHGRGFEVDRKHAEALAAA
jgi:MFS family permease